MRMNVNKKENSTAEKSIRDNPGLNLNPTTLKEIKWKVKLKVR